jgi:hypothetical protein
MVILLVEDETQNRKHTSMTKAPRGWVANCQSEIRFGDIQYQPYEIKKKKMKKTKPE